jgi:hypothetical protein
MKEEEKIWREESKKVKKRKKEKIGTEGKECTQKERQRKYNDKRKKRVSTAIVILKLFTRFA